MKLNLDMQYRGDVIIVYCEGRIVYREEAAALTDLVAAILGRERKVILDLGSVTYVDCTGVGELVQLHMRAQSRKAELKCAAANPFVRRVLDVTQVGSILKVHPNLGEALSAFTVKGEAEAEAACVGC